MATRSLKKLDFNPNGTAARASYMYVTGGTYIDIFDPAAPEAPPVQGILVFTYAGRKDGVARIGDTWATYKLIRVDLTYLDLGCGCE